MEERISGIENMIEEMDTLVNSKIPTQNIQEIWNIKKRPNLKIIGIEKEESQLKDKKKKIFSAKSEKKAFLT